MVDTQIGHSITLAKAKNGKRKGRYGEILWKELKLELAQQWMCMGIKSEQAIRKVKTYSMQQI